MNLLSESFWYVVLYANFPFYLGMAVSSGLIVGGIFNRGVNGLSRSLVTLLPLVLLVLSATTDHIIYVSQTQQLGFNAYNSLVRIFLIFSFYTLGLIIGHILVSRWVRNVYKKHGIKPNHKNEMLIGL